MLNEKKSPVLFLHEIPLILFKGQLYASKGNNIEKIGYSKKKGDKDIKLPNKEEIINMINYIKAVILKRRVNS